MTRSDMLIAVKRLFVADGTEEELDLLLGQLVNAVPYSNISDLIYYPDTERDEAQVVDEALRIDQQHRTMAVSSANHS